MSKTKLSVLFKKMQKDDKKEVLEFHVVGDELPHSQKLVEMAGNLSVIEIDGCEAGELVAEFAKLQRDSKKTVLQFKVKGDNEAKIIKLYPYAGSNVTLHLQPSQMSLEEFNEGDFDDHEGLEYTVDLGGSVNVVKNEDEAEYEVESEALSNVADLEAERMKRAAGDDDDLPF